MFYSFTLANYRSFEQESTFHMFPNIRRGQYLDHIYDDPMSPALKQAVILGANGCGKSNLMSAIAFMKGFVTLHWDDSKYHTLCDWYLDNRFRYPVAEDDATIVLSMQFSTKGKGYKYNIGIDNEGVKIEALYTFQDLRHTPVLLFCRTRDKIEFHDDQRVGIAVRHAFTKQFTENPNDSTVFINATQHIVDDADMQNVYGWFANNLFVSQKDYTLSNLIRVYEREPQLLDFTNTIFSKIGIGVRNITINHDFPERLPDCSLLENEAYENDNQLIENIHGEVVVKELQCNYIGKNDKSYTVPVIQMSEGVQRMLSVCVLMYRAIYEDSVVFVDDFETHLNPAVAKNLVKLYAESCSKGQLIYNTNNLLLVNQQEFNRIDEVWLIDKKDGYSSFIELNDFVVKSTHSISSGYLLGRYGALPNSVSWSDIAD